MGVIPKEVADKLRGKSFKDFDEFRENFWMAVGESKYADVFSAGNRGTIKAGKTPTAMQEQWNDKI